MPVQPASSPYDLSADLTGSCTVQFSDICQSPSLNLLRPQDSYSINFDCGSGNLGSFALVKDIEQIVSRDYHACRAIFRLRSSSGLWSHHGSTRAVVVSLVKNLHADFRSAYVCPAKRAARRRANDRVARIQTRDICSVLLYLSLPQSGRTVRSRCPVWETPLCGATNLLPDSRCMIHFFQIRRI